MKLLTIFFTLLFLTAVSPVYSQEEATSEAQLIVTEAAPSEYFLPYPGLLPDNPLYFLKVTRDRIIGFMIHEPLKKAEFNLLQADKRLQAGMSLFEKDKTKHELVFSTISKGENYFEQAIAEAERAKTQKIVISDFGYKLQAAQSKHKELIDELRKAVPVEEKEKFASLQDRITGFETHITKLLGETN